MTATIHQLGDAGLLTMGAVGPAVLELQKNLNALRVTFIAVPETSNYDIDTSNAVKAFQVKNSLPTTGSVDADTRDKLMEALKSLPTSTALAPPASVKSAQQASRKLPLWQAGLMALGVIALVGGLYWAVTKEDDEKEEKDEGDGEATLAGYKELKEPTEVKHPKKCSRTPDVDKGEVIIA